MAVTETPPFILVSPSLKIGTLPTALAELKCSINTIDNGIDQDTNDYDTFCGSYRVYGIARWTITLTIYQNFDPTGPWHVLRPLVGTVAAFELLPDDRLPVGPTNPLMSGNVRVPPIPFISASVNEASELEIELAIQGEPDFDETPGAGTLAAEPPA